MHDVTNLDQYLGRYGALLAQRMEDTCRPLHRPGIDPVVDTSNLLRSPYPAQAHAATGAVRTLQEKRGVIIAASCGAGKTLLSQAISQCHADGAYRAVVMCPPHLVEKWEREIKETVRNPIVRQVRTYADMVNCHRHARPFGRTWWIVSHTRAKMGAKWRPAYLWGKRWGNILRCPDCFEPIKLLKTLADVIDFVTASGGTVVHAGDGETYRCRLKYRLPNFSVIVCNGKGDSSTAAALDAARKLSQQLRGDYL